MNTTELLIQNGQLVADTLRHLADNEIDSDYFAITSASENGTEIERELVITDYALQAASTVEALVEALESAQRTIAELESDKRLLRPVGVMSESRFRALENRESRFIALWPRPGIYLPRKRPDDGVIVYARTGIKCEVKGE